MSETNVLGMFNPLVRPLATGFMKDFVGRQNKWKKWNREKTEFKEISWMQYDTTIISLTCFEVWMEVELTAFVML